MAIEIKTSKIKSEIDALQAIESKANRLPSPPSKLRNDTWVNVCPVCDAPCSTFPWTCTGTCGWTAATQPDKCACMRINDTVDAEVDEWAYPVDAEYADSPLLSAAEKALWAAAKATAKDAKDVLSMVK